MKIWSNTNTLSGLIDDMDLGASASEAEIALVGGKPIDLNEFPMLRGIFRCGVGRDNVPQREAADKGIRCGFPAPETSAIIFEETASFACHLILRCLYRNVGDMSAWTKHKRKALREREVLVIGTGQIGRRVADIMKGLVRVLEYDIRCHPPDSLEPLVRRADCVTLHIPLTEETRDWFDAEKLSWMRDGAALVNTARAAIVPQNDLYDELARNRLAAAFDVFWQEPYRGKLLDIPSDRFLVSPHVASTCTAFTGALARDFRAFCWSF